MWHRIRLDLVLGVVITLCPVAATAASRSQERQWYADAKAALDDGDLQTFQRLRRKLNDYPLHPYLDYRAFIRDLPKRSPAQFRGFVAKYARLPFDGTVRSRYLLALADASAWHSLLSVQPESPRDEALRCVYYRAHAEVGRKAEAWQGARRLWLSGKSVSDRCNPLFEAWARAGERSDGLIIDRMLLAFKARNGGLVKYLRDQLSDRARSAGDRVVALYETPRGVGDFAKRSPVTDLHQTLAKAAYRRLVRVDVEAAVDQLERVARGQRLSADERQALADAAASALMSTDDRRLRQWRVRQLAGSQRARVLGQRIRLALRQGQSAEALRWIQRLPERARQTPRWTFWRARLLAAGGDNRAATELLVSLLGQHNFYSAAAATEQGRPVDFPVRSVPARLPSVAEHKATLDRIHELIAIEKLTDAKREWRDLLKRAADLDIKLALTAYASSHDWYHLTVKGAISGRLWDYVALRFPIGFKWWFEFFSKERDLPASTMLAIARLESALDVEATSPAGARGLLQLLPATAKEEARRIRFDYQGLHTLYDPGVNIRLGSSYLKRMLDRCDDNRIFAFAAYNAGYTRVKRWRAETAGKLDVYAFIEQIPFRETRGYVQNGLMFDLYYGRLLDKTVPLLNARELRASY